MQSRSIIVDFLRPVDNLENALTICPTDVRRGENWALGFQMILTQFKDV